MYLKEIIGYEGRYYVSPCGAVWSQNGKRSRFLKPQEDTDKYHHVHLLGNTTKVHRLVAQAYLPNPLGLPMVNHKDEVKVNNNDWNLEWCTAQYNSEYSNAKWWSFLDPTGELREFKNLEKFCRDNNLDVRTMTRVAKRTSKYNSHKGWKAVPQGFVRG